MSKRPSQFVPSAPVAMSEAAPVPEYLRCPCCYGGWGGVGRDNGSYPAKNRVYLKCDKCGHDWSADIKVTTEVVSVDFRVPADLETR